MGILEEFQGVFVSGWGDRIGFAYLFRKLKPVTPDIVRDFISTNKPLFEKVSEEEWTKCQELLEENNLMKYINKGRFIQEFQKHRPDLFEVVQREPNGQVWLDTQVATVRIKLGIDVPITQWRRVETPRS